MYPGIKNNSTQQRLCPHRMIFDNAAGLNELIRDEVSSLRPLIALEGIK